MLTSEIRGAITAEHSLQHIFLIIVVIHSSERGGQSVVIAAAANLGLILRSRGCVDECLIDVNDKKVIVCAPDVR